MPSTPFQSRCPAITAEPGAPGVGPNCHHTSSRASAGMASSPASSTPVGDTWPSAPMDGITTRTGAATATGVSTPTPTRASWVTIGAIVGTGAVVVVGDVVVGTAVVTGDVVDGRAGLVVVVLGRRGAADVALVAAVDRRWALRRSTRRPPRRRRRPRPGSTSARPMAAAARRRRIRSGRVRRVLTTNVAATAAASAATTPIGEVLRPPSSGHRAAVTGLDHRRRRLQVRRPATAAQPSVPSACEPMRYMNVGRALGVGDVLRRGERCRRPAPASRRPCRCPAATTDAASASGASDGTAAWSLSWTATGSAAAAWRTTTRAWPAGTAVRSSAYAVSVGRAVGGEVGDQRAGEPGRAPSPSG